MDPIKTGAVIRSQRQKNGMTQLELAEKLCVSDKTVSKWECGSGAPDISLLPTLARALDVDVKALLYGELQERGSSSGNLKKLNFYVCPDCGNLLFSTEQADAVCCGRKLSPLPVQAAAPEERLHAELSDGEWYVTFGHEMGREHCISFIAFLSNDTLILKKLVLRPAQAENAEDLKIPRKTPFRKRAFFVSADWRRMFFIGRIFLCFTAFPSSSGIK